MCSSDICARCCSFHIFVYDCDMSRKYVLIYTEAIGSRNAQGYILERSLGYSGIQVSSILELSVSYVRHIIVRASERFASDWILEANRGLGGVRLWLGSGAGFWKPSRHLVQCGSGVAPVLGVAGSVAKSRVGLCLGPCGLEGLSFHRFSPLRRPWPPLALSTPPQKRSKRKR